MVQDVKLLLNAAEQGNADAQYKLGNCYYNGEGVKPDCAQAVDWFTKAAEQGNADAQYKLGVCYYNGEGVEQDYIQAIMWFTLAAEQGNAEAQYELGFCYYNGDGVRQDSVQAMVWFTRAAKQGHVDAKNLLQERGKQLMQSTDNPSGLWYLVPLFFGILGGIIGYFVVNDRDEGMASILLVMGIIVTIISAIFGWLIFLL